MKTYEAQLRAAAAQDRIWDALSGSTILISGATGMLGKCIIDMVMQYNDCIQKTDMRVRIIALSRNAQTAKQRFAEYMELPYFHYISCDVNVPIPECGSVDYIIHAASNTHPLQYASDPIGTITANVHGTQNLLEYGRGHHAKRFCFVSSVEIYGENRGDTEKFDESYLGYLDCNTLRAGYPESKRLGETLCNAYAQMYGIDFVIPRLSRVYGPTMLRSDSKAIAQFIKKAAAGEDIILKSDGMQRYSYTFVTDAAAGVLYILAAGAAGEAYNIADSHSDITLRELASRLAERASVQVVYQLPEEAEKRGYSTATKAMLDASKLEALGWRAAVHIDEGLARTVETLRQEIQDYRAE